MTFKIEPYLKRALEDMARDRGTTPSELVREFVRVGLGIIGTQSKAS